MSAAALWELLEMVWDFGWPRQAGPASAYATEVDRRAKGLRGSRRHRLRAERALEAVSRGVSSHEVKRRPG